MTSVAQLLGSEKEVTEVLTGQLSESLVLPPELTGLLGADEVLAGIWGLLHSMQVEEILGLAWSKYKLIEDAKAETAGKPGASRNVSMGGRKLSSVHKPDVEVVVGGLKKSVMTVELKLELTLKGIEVMVTSGNVTGIRPGSCEALVSLDLLNPLGFGRVSVFKEKKSAVVNLAPEIQPPLPAPVDS